MWRKAHLPHEVKQPRRPPVPRRSMCPCPQLTRGLCTSEPHSSPAPQPPFGRQAATAARLFSTELWLALRTGRWTQLADFGPPKDPPSRSPLQLWDLEVGVIGSSQGLAMRYQEKCRACRMTCRLYNPQQKWCSCENIIRFVQVFSTNCLSQKKKSNCHWDHCTLHMGSQIWHEWSRWGSKDQMSRFGQNIGIEGQGVIAVDKAREGDKWAKVPNSQNGIWGVRGFSACGLGAGLGGMEFMEN